MNFKEHFSQSIDTFIQSQLAKAEEGKRVLLRYVLDLTRRHIERVLDENMDENFGLAQINDLCVALDEAPVTWNEEIRSRIGASHLKEEILSQRLAVKWQIFIGELRKIVPNDGHPFDPEAIRRNNKDLYDAIRDALFQENQEANFDWELLRSKLPNELRSRFESGKLSGKERQRILQEETMKKIEELGLGDIVASLGADPKKLEQYLRLSGLKLSEMEIARIVRVSFPGLAGDGFDQPKLDRLMETCDLALGKMEILSVVPEKTDAKHFRLNVKVPEGTRGLLVRGPWKRDIKVNGNKELSFEILLTSGEVNAISLLAYAESPDGEGGQRSELVQLAVEQTGDKADEDTLVDFLNGLKESMLDNVEKDPKRKELFKKHLEESCIKKFAGSFEKGEQYVEALIQKQKNQFVIRCLRGIVKLFREIDESGDPMIRKEQHLQFFQKYCKHLIRQKRAKGETSLILANEPGLGKTVTALATTLEDEVLVVCPNSAATTWKEQEAKFFDKSFMVNLAGCTSPQRMKMLEETDRRVVLTNVEFVRFKDGSEGNGEGGADRKFKSLNRRRDPKRKRVTIVDESHFLKNDSQQSEGVSKLEDDFMLLMSASPYRNPTSLRKVMARILPEDPRFTSQKAFQKAFPPYDPMSLKALYLMAEPFVIRFLKSEVMPTYDRSRPIKGQPLSLPEKNYIAPSESGSGLFTLTPAQEQAIFELFSDWKMWTEKYDHYMPKGDLAVEDGIRGNDDQLTKSHALRQIVNNPAYIGSAESSPKHQECMGIVKKELAANEKNKVVVFCRYHEQVKAYERLLKKEGVACSVFTGEVTQQGTKKDEQGKEILYKVDKGDSFELGADGKPVVAKGRQKSRPMLAIDYERLSFQNSPETRVILATLSAGAQSVTFTAAHAMIFDDLPRDYTEKYQAEDRIHRIDNEHAKHEVRYYSLISKYSDEFLKRMRQTMTVKGRSDGSEEEIKAFDRWFGHGSYDQVSLRNLGAQRISFELLNNGIQSDIEDEEEVAFNMG